jgi:hypothetical protein
MPLTEPEFRRIRTTPAYRRAVWAARLCVVAWLALVAVALAGSIGRMPVGTLLLGLWAVTMAALLTALVLFSRAGVSMLVSARSRVPTEVRWMRREVLRDISRPGRAAARDA